MYILSRIYSIEGAIVVEIWTTQEKHDYELNTIKCAWCGKNTTDPFWSYTGRYCSSDCKYAGDYNLYIGSLIITLIVGTLGILSGIQLYLANTSQSLYYLQMSGAIFFVLCICVLIMAVRIRTGYRMRKIANEDIYW